MKGVNGMTEDNPQPEVTVERIDADAVCERCGAVSPEETLLCKTCGNNLRDQRARRIAGDRGFEPGALAPERRSWIGKGLVVLGILLIIWVAINLERIEDLLAGTQTTSIADAKVYWSGPNSAFFEELHEDLKANPLTPQEIDSALRTPVKGNGYEGRYVLFQPNALRQVPIGEAVVRQQGDGIVFVAVLSRSDIEFRGEARFEGSVRIAARDSAGVKAGNRYYGASGFARPLDMGGFECFGLSDLNDDNYSVLAYRVP
jgi:ribosomal protein L40E